MSVALKAKTMGLIVAILSAFSLFGCFEKEVPGGELTIQNDILDKEFNSFSIDSVVTKTGATGYRKVLKPGERATIPHPSVVSFRLMRKYSDHTKVYHASCPKNFNKQITVKLIDVHTNRIAGGCELTRRGRISSGGILEWEKLESST